MTEKPTKNEKGVSNGSVKDLVRYELVAPEGGWGHVITLSLALMFVVTVVPLASFGLIYGEFLRNLGDEISSTTVLNAVFNTVNCFTGLATSPLLQKYSYRLIGLLGALFFSVGYIGTIFVTSVFQMIITFGVIQAIGFGFMMPASYTAFNCYFDKKKNVMMGAAQAVMVATSILSPIAIQYLMDTFGFRGSVTILAAISFHSFIAMQVLQPVEWHMIKKPIEGVDSLSEKVAFNGGQYTPVELKSLSPANSCEKIHKSSLREEVLKAQIEPLLLDNKMEEGHIKEPSFNQVYIASKPRASIISMDGRAISVSTLNQLKKKKNTSIWHTLTKTIDLSLFKDPAYLNISVGLSMGYVSDLGFITLIPLLLSNAGIGIQQITYLMAIHFIADLVARILLAVVSGIWQIKNKYWFLGSAALACIFRTIFLLGNGFKTKMITLGVLGFLRAFIQTPLPLVISEEYPDNFSEAFSLYMVVCGAIFLLGGSAVTFVKQVTNDDTTAAHVYTVCYLLCVIPWIIEIIIKRLKKKEDKQ